MRFIADQKLAISWETLGRIVREKKKKKAKMHKLRHSRSVSWAHSIQAKCPSSCPSCPELLLLQLQQIDIFCLPCTHSSPTHSRGSQGVDCTCTRNSSQEFNFQSCNKWKQCMKCLILPRARWSQIWAQPQSPNSIQHPRSNLHGLCTVHYCSAPPTSIFAITVALLSYILSTLLSFSLG